MQRSLSTVGDLIASELYELDLERLNDVRGWVCRQEPDIIVNAAAYTAVDQAESEPEKAKRLNAWLVHYSTAYVFDGEKATPYDEGDAANPLSVYGRTKFEGEEHIRHCHAKHMVFRTSWVYAARGKDFAKDTNAPPIHTARGSAAPMRTRTGCCASTCPRARTCRATPSAS